VSSIGDTPSSWLELRGGVGRATERRGSVGGTAAVCGVTAPPGRPGPGGAMAPWGRRYGSSTPTPATGCPFWFHHPPKIRTAACRHGVWQALDFRQRRCASVVRWDSAACRPGESLSGPRGGRAGPSSEPAVAPGREPPPRPGRFVVAVGRLQLAGVRHLPASARARDEPWARVVRTGGVAPRPGDYVR